MPTASSDADCQDTFPSRVCSFVATNTANTVAALRTFPAMVNFLQAERPQRKQPQRARGRAAHGISLRDTANQRLCRLKPSRSWGTSSLRHSLKGLVWAATQTGLCPDLIG